MDRQQFGIASGRGGTSLPMTKYVFKRVFIETGFI
ncbi:hypothetical protein J2S78_000008 [Salibacterium salarium]|nr:hypothetical protein [Salibacterium salarium]